ncbi:hypothetical protein [Bradyrhizobium sp. dw_411]|uniref:hypothetical protein n=1 Tax=Bradyrhizobium sp. dw_411 TaxID=2720082 RepID=UPI001BD06485|nr:hypothetical protein [Bradyrhizobium sp. dw_411]
MNAPVRLEPELEDLTQEFAECCAIQAWFLNEGWISKQQAVDNLQHLVESLNVPVEDRDAAQAIMAEAFRPRDEAEEEDLPSDYAAQIVRQWELADARDRWQHTGEPPPVPGTTPFGNSRTTDRVPQSTIDALKFVVSLGDAEYLAKWLRDHSNVAPALLEQMREAA